MIYKKNLKFINEMMPELYKTIILNEPLYRLEKKRLENQFNFIVENKNASCFLHSIYDIDDEMREMFRNVKDDSKTIILFGFGCGHSADYIKRNYPQIQNFYIIEPTSQIFKEYLKNTNINSLVESVENISFLINKKVELVADLVLHLLLRDPKTEIIFNISYRTLFKDYFDRLQALILKKIRTTTSSMVTIRKSTEKWTVNSVKNLQKLEYSIENIAEKLSSKPAIIVSAGPSLDKNIHLLEKIKNKVNIFAVGSAIKILDNHGIDPHFRVAIEGNKAGERTFHDLKNTTIPLIHASNLYHGVFEKYEGSKLCMIINSDLLGKYIYKKLGIPFLEIETGPSVANATFDLLCQCGCKKVIFIGQDMCFNKGKIHAKGTINPKNQSYYKEKSHIKMEDIFGNTVYTIPAYLMIKYDLNDRVKKYPNTEVINATEGGLGIEGVKNKPLQSFVKEDLIDADTFDNNLFEMEIGKNDIWYKDQISNILENLKEEVQRIIDINNDRLHHLKNIGTKLQKSTKKTRIFNDLEYVKKIDDQLEEINFYRKVVKVALTSEFIKSKYKYRYNEYSDLSEGEALQSEMLDRALAVDKYIKMIFNLL